MLGGAAHTVPRCAAASRVKLRYTLLVGLESLDNQEDMSHNKNCLRRSDRGGCGRDLLLWRIQLPAAHRTGRNQGGKSDWPLLRGVEVA